MCCRLAVILGVSLLAGPLLAQQPPDFSGAWTSNQVVVLRNDHTTPWGWDQLAENLTRARTYLVTIDQMRDEVTMTFPGGSNNILTTAASLVGAEARTTVTNRGDWWMKDVVSAHWAGASLEISSTTSTGWWKTVTPDRAEPQVTDFKKRFTMQLNADAGELSLRALLVDEKGELEYVQVFHRSAARLVR